MTQPKTVVKAYASVDVLAGLLALGAVAAAVGVAEHEGDPWVYDALAGLLAGLTASTRYFVANRLPLRRLGQLLQ